KPEATSPAQTAAPPSGSNNCNSKPNEDTHATRNPEDPVEDAGLFDDFEADHPLTTATLDDLRIDHDPDAVVAEDAQGKPVSQQTLDDIETLTPGQLLSTILIGAMKAIFSMAPEQLQIKRSHGADATLVIVQDIETAYQTLGIGVIPEDARRPKGPGGIIPTVIQHENPDNPTSLCRNPKHL